jgi:hypothetical protein
MFPIMLHVKDKVVRPRQWRRDLNAAKRHLGAVGTHAPQSNLASIRVVHEVPAVVVGQGHDRSRSKLTPRWVLYHLLKWSSEACPVLDDETT